MKSMSIYQKLWAFAILFTVLVVGQSGYMVMQLDQTRKDMQYMRDVEGKIIENTHTLQLAVIQVQQWLTDISATRAAPGFDDGLDEAEAQAETFRVTLQELTALDQENAANYQELGPLFEAYYETGKKMAHAYIDGGPEAGNKMMSAFDSTAEGLKESMDVTLFAVSEDKTMRLDSLFEDTRNAEQLMIVFALVFLAIAVALVVGAKWVVIKPLMRLTAMARDIAEGEGDLTKRLDDSHKDELGEMAHWFNEFVGKIQHAISLVQESNEKVGTASEQLSMLTRHTEEQINNQLGETDMVATAMNEMLATSQEVANNAVQTAESTNTANTDADAGNRVVQRTIDTIDALAREVDNARDVIVNLGEDTKNIGSVLDVIKGISEQTNLLALNAAIEAARAGEQGRGFAVVADEVRTLAMRTQESTTEIQDMINRLQAGSEKAVSVMKAGSEQADACVEMAREAGNSLKSITDSVNSITSMNDQIASASEEQSAVVAELDQNVINIAEASKETVSDASQISSAATELQELVHSMNRLVKQFKVS
ncbi:MAG: methyl-accepting chemotaxis protein [Gammaproteobacteria bacterium]